MALGKSWGTEFVAVVQRGRSDILACTFRRWPTRRFIRDIKADWRCWSCAERIAAVAIVASALVAPILSVAEGGAALAR